MQDMQILKDIKIPSEQIIVQQQQTNILLDSGDSKIISQQSVQDKIESSQLIAWKQESDEFYEHFKNQVSVCSCVVYCDCELHETMSILFVQNKYSNDEISKLVLPGGKRDIAGKEGRAKHQKYDETCWQTIKGEFQEEVNIDITQYCNKQCSFFDLEIGDRIIRTYFLKIQCKNIPNLEYSRFRMYESFRREWVDLEQIIKEFKFLFKQNKDKMQISPKMFQTIKYFGQKIIKKMWMDHRQSVDSLKEKEINKSKLFKIISLFSIINKNIKKSEFNFIKQKMCFTQQLQDTQPDTFIMIIDTICLNT